VNALLTVPDPIAASFRPLSPDQAIERVLVDGVVKKPFAGNLVLHVIHDGDVVPAQFAELTEDAKAKADLDETFVRERDFGAGLVAAAAAQALSLPHWLRVRLARCVLDAGRFFGIETSGADPLDRLAIEARIASRLDDDGLDHLAECHARIESTILDALLDTSETPRVAIGVHTYDPRNADGSKRPEVAVLSVPRSIALNRAVIARYRDPVLRSADLPQTAEARFVDALIAELKAQNFKVGRNDPYHLPDGSLEVRAHHRDMTRRGGVPVAARQRPQAVVVEVRKDLLFTGDDARGAFAPRAVRAGAAERIGSALGGAIQSALRALG
jgi:hypothetical protein